MEQQDKDKVGLRIAGGGGLITLCCLAGVFLGPASQRGGFIFATILFLFFTIVNGGAWLLERQNRH